MNTISENITTPGTKNVTYPVANREEGHGFLSQENTDSEFGIVLIQEWWGLNKSITLTADKFAKQGFRVICPDIYRGKVGKDREQAGHLMSGLDFQGAISDIAAAGLYLKSLGCKKVGITGFCMGGALTIATLASSDVFSAGVPFYGIPDLSYFKLENIKVPVLAHFGDLDPAKGFSDPESARNLEAKAKEAGVNFTLHMWEGGDHAFMNQDSERYNPDIAAKALQETVEFFRKNSEN
jgi:carboxymethylenebutenolidase